MLLLTMKLLYPIIDNEMLEEHCMSYLPQLLALASVWAIVVISPGPDFVATVHHAVSRSRRDGLLVALGIAASTTIWVTVSIVGLGVLFAHVSWLVEIIRTLGALYLTYLRNKNDLESASSQTRSRAPGLASKAWISLAYWVSH